MLGKSVLAVSSEDNSISIWDISLERDLDAKATGAKVDEKDIPPQLMFLHQVCTPKFSLLRFHACQ
jgi:ribosome assembly protein RRB1